MEAVNPRTNRLMRPKVVYVENAVEALIQYDNYGTDWVYNKHTGTHKLCRSSQFANAFDRISSNK